MSEYARSSSDDILTTIARQLTRIADALEADRPAPGYRAPLAMYPTWDWSTIDATVVESDAIGATVVTWGHHTFTRRTHPKFGNDVWFSRGAGRDEEGAVRYERLITFATSTASEELPRSIREYLTSQSDTTAQARDVATRPGRPSADTVTTQSSDGPMFEDGSPDLPADPPAASKTADPRPAVFALLPKLIAAGVISPQDANAYTKRARIEGPTAILDELLKLA